MRSIYFFKEILLESIKSSALTYRKLQTIVPIIVMISSNEKDLIY